MPRDAAARKVTKQRAGVTKQRKTHHSIAVRMLGERRGTGDTEGVAYLEQARGIPLFASGCPFAHGAQRPDAEPELLVAAAA